MSPPYPCTDYTKSGIGCRVANFFGKELLTWLTICSLSNVSFCKHVLLISYFALKDMTLILIVPIPGHCLLLTPIVESDLVISITLDGRSWGHKALYLCRGEMFSEDG